jgi:hypothetical protein
MADEERLRTDEELLDRMQELEEEHKALVETQLLPLLQRRDQARTILAQIQSEIQQVETQAGALKRAQKHLRDQLSTRR